MLPGLILLDCVALPKPPRSPLTLAQAPLTGDEVPRRMATVQLRVPALGVGTMWPRRRKLKRGSPCGPGASRLTQLPLAAWFWMSSTASASGLRSSWQLSSLSLISEVRGDMLTCAGKARGQAGAVTLNAPPCLL